MIAKGLCTYSHAFSPSTDQTMIGSFRRAMGCNGTSGGQRSVASQL